MSSAVPRSEPGTYALHLRADAEQTIEVGAQSEDDFLLTVGALGDMTVRPGHYIYVGSAFGPGGVRARVQRHARDDGATHWHADYLRAVTTLEHVWWAHDEARRECDWAATMHALPGAAIPMRGFGASDCDCPAHLYRFDGPPSLDAFRERLRARDPDHAIARCMDSVGAGGGER